MRPADVSQHAMRKPLPHRVLADIHRRFFFGSTALVYLAYFLWGLSLLSLPVIDTMMADYIETPDRSRVYSTMLVANFIPGSITGFLAGQYGASLTPPLLLVLAAGLETVGFASILAKVRDKGVASVIHRAPISLGLRGMVSASSGGSSASS